MRQFASKAADHASLSYQITVPSFLVIFLGTCLALAGCTKKEISYPTGIPVPPSPSSPGASSSGDTPSRSTPPTTVATGVESTPAAAPPKSDINDALITFYTRWRRTPYRLGGLSPKGIDCSGFTYLFFKENYNITLPRTVSGQAVYGKKISGQDLQPGDLVFFKTGFFQRHVGICMDEQRFAHASSSNGVMVSRLDNAYWKRKYWKARRLIN